MISLFSHDDEDMLHAKSNFKVEVHDVEVINSNNYKATVVYKGTTRVVYLDDEQFCDLAEFHTIPWHFLEGQRGRANNSVILLREATTEEYFKQLMVKVKNSRAGEPGVYWTNDLEMLCNPCVEIAIPCGGFCNLTATTVDDLESEEDFHQRVRDAVFIGTLQAGYTDFHYVRDMWRDNAERDALLGVSFTGIASGKIFNYDIKVAAEIAKTENERVANLIGINIAKRIGCVKPEGTTSLVLSTSSGIHAWHNDFYIRIVEIGKDKALYKYALEKLGDEFVKDSVYSPDTTGIFYIPIKAPEGATLRTESPLDLLERVKKIQIDWIRGTHREGSNCHNVSVTVSVKPDEWSLVGNWMWTNREFYNGISLMDYDGGTYPQMPHTDCTAEEYYRLAALLEEKVKDFNIDEVIEIKDHTNHKTESVACGGSGCELTTL